MNSIPVDSRADLTASTLLAKPATAPSLASIRFSVGPDIRALSARSF